jgi:hypothetical protein
VRGNSSESAHSKGLAKDLRSAISPLESAVTHSRASSSKRTTLNPYPATLTRYPQPKSNPCHSYEYMGGWGGIPKNSHFIHSSALSFSGEFSLVRQRLKRVLAAGQPRRIRRADQPSYQRDSRGVHHPAKRQQDRKSRILVQEDGTQRERATSPNHVCRCRACGTNAYP